MFFRRQLLVSTILAPALIACLPSALCQAPAEVPASSSGKIAKWKPAGPAARPVGAGSAPVVTASAIEAQPAQPLAPANLARAPIARVTKGPDTLPNDAGQEWRDYDISPYTARVTSTNRPEQAILDWILRETGYEAWHTEPLALLSANRRTLRVFHTPAMHAVVSEIVDRFVNTEAESQAFSLRVVTLPSPDWRTPVHSRLRSIPAQTPGVQAWLLAKEDAALLVAEFRKKYGFQEHSTAQLLVNNGQAAIVPKITARNYIRDIIQRPEAWPGFEPQTAQITEGFNIEFHPLLSLDGKIVDALLKCDIDHLENMLKVNINVPTAVAPRQSTTIEVPQLVGSRLQERFRWPAEQVLLISLGIGPTPLPLAATGMKIPLLSQGGRNEMLVFVENKGKIGAQPTALQPAGSAATLYQRRYKPIQ